MRSVFDELDQKSLLGLLVFSLMIPHSFDFAFRLKVGVEQDEMPYWVLVEGAESVHQCSLASRKLEVVVGTSDVWRG